LAHAVVCGIPHNTAHVFREGDAVDVGSSPFDCVLLGEDDQLGVRYMLSAACAKAAIICA